LDSVGLGPASRPITRACASLRSSSDLSAVAADHQPRHHDHDAIDAHPWVGAKLSLDPAQPGTLQFFESIGGRLQTLGVSTAARFDAWSALVNYILGVAGQNAANARSREGDRDRTLLLGSVAARWGQLDPSAFPFLRDVAVQIPGHHDRQQFLAGIDFILAGIRAV